MTWQHVGLSAIRYWCWVTNGLNSKAEAVTSDEVTTRSVQLRSGRAKG